MAFTAGEITNIANAALDYYWAGRKSSTRPCKTSRS